MSSSDEKTPLLHQDGGATTTKGTSSAGGGGGGTFALKSDEYRERQLSRKLMIKAEQEKMKNMLTLSPQQCFLAILLYVVVTVCFFSYWLEDWTMIDSIYFAIVTFSTIGYGDVVPDTRLARLFTCFWAISGVACLGLALGILGSKIVEVAEEDQKQALIKQQSQVFDLFKVLPRTPSGNLLGEDDIEAAEKQKRRNSINPVEEATSQFCDVINSPKSARLAILFAIMAVMLYFMSVAEGWSFTLTFYYGIITACTVGYGDYSPDTQIGRLICIFYIPLAIAVMGVFLDLVANSIIDSRKNTVLKQQVWDKELTLKDLKVMDADGDGNVTQLEFLEFMLVSMNQVDQDLLDELRAHFEKLDKDKSGILDKADLVNIAEYNLQR